MFCKGANGLWLRRVQWVRHQLGRDQPGSHSGLSELSPPSLSREAERPLDAAGKQDLSARNPSEKRPSACDRDPAGRAPWLGRADRRGRGPGGQREGAF